jgi:Xaa-Pro aminopeptidase
MNHHDNLLGIPKFSLAERERRWKQVRGLMARDDLDALFVPPNTGLFDMFQANARYLTGLGGNHCMIAAVFPREGEVTAISSPDVDKQIWLERQDWVTDIRNVSRGWGFTGEAVERLKELGHIKRLGVTGLSGNTRYPEGVTSHGTVERLRAMLPEVELVNANALMEEARFVKSSEEIEFLRAGVVLVERAIEVMAAESRPGVPENVVYAHMISSIVEGGGELPSMILWSAGWPQPPSNSYLPTRRPLRQGDIILPEIEARWGGYVAQNTQPLCIGRAPAEYHEMFALQQQALRICYDMLRPGERLGAIADRINGLGNKDFDCRILMHGRGLGDDAPLAVYGVRDETMANWVMEESSAFIIKPVVWNKDRSLRVCWGDTVVCTSVGAQRLGKRPATIIETEKFSDEFIATI